MRYCVAVFRGGLLVLRRGGF